MTKTHSKWQIAKEPEPETESTPVRTGTNRYGLRQRDTPRG